MDWINSENNQDQWMALVSMVMVPQMWRKYWQSQYQFLKGFWNKHKIFWLPYYVVIFRMIVQSYTSDIFKWPRKEPHENVKTRPKCLNASSLVEAEEKKLYNGKKQSPKCR